MHTACVARARFAGRSGLSLAKPVKHPPRHPQHRLQAHAALMQHPCESAAEKVKTICARPCESAAPATKSAAKALRLPRHLHVTVRKCSASTNSVPVTHTDVQNCPKVRANDQPFARRLTFDHPTAPKAGKGCTALTAHACF